jgi:peroxiredoxin
MPHRLEKLAIAPDFELKDTWGKLVRLSNYRGKQVVVLAVLRGFA